MFIIKGSGVGNRVKQHISLLGQISFFQHRNLTNCFVIASVPFSTFSLHISIIVTVVEASSVVHYSNQLVFWCQAFKVVVQQFLWNFESLIKFDF